MNCEAGIENPVDVTITNNTNINQTIRYFMVNFQTTLKPGDSVTFTVTNSAELAFYTKMKQDVEGNSGGNKDIILNFPDPLYIGEIIDDSILSPDFLLELIDRANNGEIVNVILSQSGITYNATVNPLSGEECELLVIDGEGDMLQCGFETVDDDTYYVVVTGHNCMRKWNIVTPK